jgi:hypothetical protein
MKQREKVTCNSWIIRAVLSDGRTVNLDLSDSAAKEVDDFITEVEKFQSWDDWIMDEVI